MKQTNTQTAAARLLARYDQQNATAATCGFDSYIDMVVDLDYFDNGYSVLAYMAQNYGLRCAMYLLRA